MKKIITSLSVIFFLLSFNSIEVKAAIVPLDSAQLDQSSLVMLARLEEIKAMDMSTLSRVEKKAIRKELREMKKEAKNSGNGGVYLSVGGIIIIILLLILLL